MISQKNPDVLIVGGGVVGMSCAYYLTRAGARVTVIEATTVGDPLACSYGNQGLICPSHAVPIAAPGVITQGLGWLFDPTSPLYIRRPWRPEMSRWLWQFARAATKKRAEVATAAMAEFLQHSYNLHKEIASTAITTETNTPTEHHPYGYAADGAMYAFMSEKALNHHLEAAQQVTQHGIPLQALSGKEVRQREPALSQAIVGGVLYPRDAHVEPRSFVRFLYAQLLAAGVQVVEHTDVIRLQRHASRASHTVLTTRGEFTAGEVVIAAGSWSPQVASDLNLRLPIQAAKGYSVTFTNPPWRPTLPVNFGEARAMVTPLPHGVRIGGTFELSGLDRSVTLKRVQAILDGAMRFVPGSRFDAHTTGVEIWRGLRPLSPDTLPVIGRPHAHSDVILATGHGMLGVSLGPATGEAVAALATGATPTVDLTPYNPNRFA